MDRFDDAQDSAAPSFFERLKGRRTKDIKLPSEGREDPRLRKPDVLGAAGKAAEGLKALRKVAKRKKEY